MSYKIPVVASSVGGIPNIIENGRSGLLVPPEDSESISTAIKRLYEDSEYAVMLGNCGYNLVKKHYDLKEWCLTIEKIYAGELQ